MADGLEIAIPPPVLISRHQQPALARYADQISSLFRRQSEGLVDHDMALCLQALLCQLEVGIAGGGHNDELDARVGKHFIQAARQLHLRVGPGGIIAAALDDARQLQPRRCFHHGGMKDAPR